MITYMYNLSDPGIFQGPTWTTWRRGITETWRRYHQEPAVGTLKRGDLVEAHSLAAAQINGARGTVFALAS